MGTLSVDKILKTSTGAATFTLPATDGAAGQVWQTDGSGQLSVAALAADTVTATQIATGAVGTTEIATDAVTATEIAADAVGVSELSATGTASASTFLRGDNAWAAPASAGITEIDQWNLSGSNLTWSGAQTNVLITATFTRQFAALQNMPLGTGMTEATGIWTFPSTGFWLVAANGDFFRSSTDADYCGITPSLSTDSGSNYTNLWTMNTSVMSTTGGIYGNTVTFIALDITNVSTHKLRFVLNASNSSGAAWPRTNYLFIRLADT